MPGLQTVAAMVGVLGVIGVGGVSRARHNFSEKTEAALNAQINLEYEASHAYAAMSALLLALKSSSFDGDEGATQTSYLPGEGSATRTLLFDTTPPW